MAYKDSNIFDRGTAEPQTEGTQTLQFTGETAELPHDSYIRDADFSQDGNDLVMNGPQGTLVVEDYFAGLESPALIGPSGATLSPELVESFTTSGDQYAMNGTMSDVSPIGAIQEISGDATITRGDGTTESLSIGSPVYQGDIIETDGGSAVNVSFIDESSFAVSEETRLAIDEYVYDPASQGGVQNFSVLKGVFVYTSGFIGREDPDDVSIETPVGSIGIRGTIIAGDVNSGEITVVEGAIVLRSPLGEEMTLASQFETGKFGSNGISNLGQKSANEVIEKFSIVSKVAPNLFSSINDAAAEAPQAQQEANDKQPVQEQKAPDKAQKFDANGATDKNGDNKVDGTVENSSGEQTDASGENSNGGSEGEAPESVAEVGPEATVETGPTNNGGMEALAVQAPEIVEISEFSSKHHGKHHGKKHGKSKGHHGKHGKHHDSSIEDNFENQTTSTSDVSLDITGNPGDIINVDLAHAKFSISSDDVIVNANSNSNTIHLKAKGVTINAEDGNDIIIAREVEGTTIHGGDGNDNLQFLDGNLLDDLNDGTVTDFSYHGGNGSIDEIQLDVEFGDLNFVNILSNGNCISDIEKIDTATDSAVLNSTNVVTLRFQDVIAMTDGANTLTLEMGSSDTLNLVNFTSDGVTGGKTNDSSYDTYVFTDGSDTITLLVSNGVSEGSMNIA